MPDLHRPCNKASRARKQGVEMDARAPSPALRQAQQVLTCWAQGGRCLCNPHAPSATDAHASRPRVHGGRACAKNKRRFARIKESELVALEGARKKLSRSPSSDDHPDQLRRHQCGGITTLSSVTSFTHSRNRNLGPPQTGPAISGLASAILITEERAQSRVQIAARRGSSSGQALHI